MHPPIIEFLLNDGFKFNIRMKYNHVFLTLYSNLLFLKLLERIVQSFFLSHKKSITALLKYFLLIRSIFTIYDYIIRKSPNKKYYFIRRFFSSYLLLILNGLLLF